MNVHWGVVPDIYIEIGINESKDEIIDDELKGAFKRMKRSRAVEEDGFPVKVLATVGKRVWQEVL